MKKSKFIVLCFALAAVVGITCFAKTHKTDIVAVDTIEYTLGEEDKLSAELFIEEDGLYEVKLFSLSTSGSFTPKISIKILDDGKEIYSFVTDKRRDLEGTEPESSGFLFGLSEGEYKIEIENLTKFSDVSFTIETTFTHQENIETYGNNSFEQATEISIGEKYFGGAAMSDEIDFFSFEMPYDGVAYIQMYSPKAKFFTLYDGSKNKIGDIGIEIDEADKIYELRSGLPEGIYYISVQPDEDYSLPLYTIEVETSKGDYFEKEYNNDNKSAVPVESGKEYQGNLFGIHDRDVFSFTLENDGGVIIDFTDTIASKDWHYSINLSDGDNILFSGDECGRETISLNLSKGTYYLTVSSLGHSSFTSMAYKLKVSSDVPLAVCPPEEEGAGSDENGPLEDVIPFDDVSESDWYYDELLEAKSLGLINGVGGNKYNPKGNVTLAEVIAMAARIHNMNGGENAPLESSPVGKWYNSYITFAVNTGIINREDFDDFDKSATRAEVAYIFANVLGDTETGENIIIPDVDEDTEYCDSIHKLYALGILKGDDEKGTFYPERNLTRAEAAAILLRVHKAV